MYTIFILILYFFISVLIGLINSYGLGGFFDFKLFSEGFIFAFFSGIPFIPMLIVILFKNIFLDDFD